MPRRLASIFAQVKAHPFRVALAVVPLLLVALALFVPNISQASDLESATLSLMNAIFSFFMSIFGRLLVLFTDVLIYIATYSNITDVEAVKVGWAVVRDLANMGFIVAMLLISFGTIFRFQEYRYSRLLGKLVIMAILINFSRLIASLLVDFSQVIMLTFVNAFRDLAAGNITEGFGVADIVAFSQTASAEGGDINLLSVLGAMFAGIVMLFIATAIVASFVVFLVQRMIMLWIYIILSPMAYMMAVLPGSLGRFWSGWWETFMKYLIRGPVIGFYLWLAFTIASFTNNTFTTGSPTSSVDPLGTDSGVSTSSVAYFANQASTGANVLNYIVFAALLIAGLQQAAAAGGVAGKIAGKSMATFEKWGSNLGKGAGALALAPVKYAGDVVKRPAVTAAEKTLGFMSKMPLIGGAAMAMNSRLRAKTQRADDAQAKMVENLSASELIQLGSGSAVSATAAARRKVAIEKLMNTGQMSKASAAQQEMMHAQYERDIGMKIKVGPNGKMSDFATDQQGLKIYKDYLKKNPAPMGDYMEKAHAAGNVALETYWHDKIEERVKELRPNDLADMTDSAWYRGRPGAGGAQTAFARVAIPILSTRVAANPQFTRRLQQEVPANVRDAINNAAGGILFQTEEGGVQVVTPPSQLMRKREVRTRNKFRDAALQDEHLSGVSTFAAGASNMLAISDTALRELGITNVRAGTSITPNQKAEVAGLMAEIVTKDIAAMEQQLGPAIKQREQLLNKQKSGPLSDAEQVQLQDLNRQYQPLQRQKAALERLENPNQLQNIQFIVRDRKAGDAKNIIAEEESHAIMEAMDPDRSFRREIINSQFSPQERVQIADQISKQQGGQYMTIEQAFDEYFAKGLANSGNYKGEGKDAIQLKSGLALQLRRQAEAKGVQMRFVGNPKAQTKEQAGAPENYAAALQNQDAEQEKLDTYYTQGEQQLAQLKARMVETKAAANRMRLGEAGRRYEAEAKQAEAEYNAYGKQFDELESQWKASTVKGKNLQTAATRAARGESPTATLPERYERDQAAATSFTPATDSIPAAPRYATEEAGTTNITNNIRNEITQVVKSAPQGFRDTMKLTSTSLDSALRSSLVMKSLMTNLRNGFDAMQKSEKNLSAETTGFLGKRLSNLQKHVDGNDIEGFREDFGKLQKEFDSIIE
ncbi:MAG: hypothetical protein WCV85_05690 [Patescibacteria group bacterium]|jgi:hypothetical protein